jgi:hypothetical protein
LHSLLLIKQTVDLLAPQWHQTAALSLVQLIHHLHSPYQRHQFAFISLASLSTHTSTFPYMNKTYGPQLLFETVKNTKYILYHMISKNSSNKRQTQPFVHYSACLWGTAVAQWLRYCSTNRKVAGSIPDGVIGIFHWHNPSDHNYGPGIDSASNRNEYQEHFLGVKAAGT